MYFDDPKKIKNKYCQYFLLNHKLKVWSTKMLVTWKPIMDFSSHKANILKVLQAHKKSSSLLSMWVYIYIYIIDFLSACGLWGESEIIYFLFVTLDVLPLSRFATRDYSACRKKLSQLGSEVLAEFGH